MTKRGACIICRSNALIGFLHIERVPVSCNHLCFDQNAALQAAQAPISLHFCSDCGHVFNLGYDPSRLNYQPGYENSLRGSERFREYDEALVQLLIERYELHNRFIIEIGCGRADFLRTLCERGGNFGLGYDPSYSRTNNRDYESNRVVIRSEVYSGWETERRPDFLFSRHTLEHVGDPSEILTNMRTATGQSSVPVFFEVPNGLYTLRDGGIWDIIYEHCSYFTPTSLARLFNETRYEGVVIAEAFGGQFLTVHARTGVSTGKRMTNSTSHAEDLVRSFVDTYHNKLREWTLRLQQLARQGRRVALWGAGAKAATFLNLLHPSGIDYVVDVNPRKHGCYMIGTGQRIVSPQFLLEYRPDDIICMNPNYLEEIGSQILALQLPAALLAA